LVPQHLAALSGQHGAGVAGVRGRILGDAGERRRRLDRRGGDLIVAVAVHQVVVAPRLHGAVGHLRVEGVVVAVGVAAAPRGGGLVPQLLDAGEAGDVDRDVALEVLVDLLADAELTDGVAAPAAHGAAVDQRTGGQGAGLDREDLLDGRGLGSGAGAAASLRATLVAAGFLLVTAEEQRDREDRRDCQPPRVFHTTAIPVRGRSVSR
jgi:hypothetical protein